MSPTQRRILDHLSDGPLTAQELADLIGTDPGCIRVAINRLILDGYEIVNYWGSGRIGFYVLAPRICARCKCELARDHTDTFCSPCQRAVEDISRRQLHATLFEWGWKDSFEVTR